MPGDDLLKYQIAFSSLRGLNTRLGRELLARIGDERLFFEMSSRQLASAMGCNSRVFDDDNRRQALEIGVREASFIRSAGNIKPLYFTDEDAYPARLENCDDAPMMLYATGNCDLNDCKVMGIVGTRHATPYGLSFLHNLVTDLKKSCDNIIIVSGLAYGIDVGAHREALHADIPTVGVLAHGLTTIYPAVHRGVAVDMVRHGGMLLTEYRSDSVVHKGNFLARNRVIAGLCDCVVVVESAEKGGALLTARIASGYCRDVFALPGRVGDVYSAGCNRLIVDHIASLVTCGDDIIEAMGWTRRVKVGQQLDLKVDLPPERQVVVDYLSRHEDAVINRMSVDLDRPVAKLLALLVDMEFSGEVMALPGGRYRLA